jgi:hypothetical protein
MQWLLGTYLWANTFAAPLVRYIIVQDLTYGSGKCGPPIRFHDLSVTCNSNSLLEAAEPDIYFCICAPLEDSTKTRESNKRVLILY